VTGVCLPIAIACVSLAAQAKHLQGEQLGDLYWFAYGLREFVRTAGSLEYGLAILFAVVFGQVFATRPVAKIIATCSLLLSVTLAHYAIELGPLCSLNGWQQIIFGDGLGPCHAKLSLIEKLLIPTAKIWLFNTALRVLLLGVLLQVWLVLFMKILKSFGTIQPDHA